MYLRVAEAVVVSTGLQWKGEKDTELQHQQSDSDKYVKQNSDHIKENNVSVKLYFSEAISG